MEQRTGSCGGVLLRDEIKRLVDEKNMIEGFEPTCLQAASYDMRLGDEYYKEGKLCRLSESNSTLTIPPHDIVFVSYIETFNMPANVVARYDLRMRFLWQGLIMQTGTQFDPGYQGMIISMLFNLSNKEIEICRRGPLATVEFLYTTPVRIEEKPIRPIRSLEDALPPGIVIESGLRMLASSVEQAESNARRLNNVVYVAGAFMIAILGIVVSTIAAVAAAPSHVDWWAYVVGVAIYAVTIGGFVLLIRRGRGIGGKSNVC